MTLRPPLPTFTYDDTGPLKIETFDTATDEVKAVCCQNHGWAFEINDDGKVLCFHCGRAV